MALPYSIPETHHQAELLTARLPPLLVAAERVAATVSQGVHGRRRVGQGETFWQYRQYEWGDPMQMVDWRQSARSDRVFLREMEWEAAQSVWFWRDGSASMDYRSRDGGGFKAERADLILLSLAVLLVRAGERIALMGDVQQPATGRRALLNVAAALEEERAPRDSLPAAQMVPRHGRVVLMGDFLPPLPEIAENLRCFAAQGAVGHVIQVLDPAEETLPFEGRVEFEGMEGEGRLTIGRVETVRDAYREELARHTDGLRALCRTMGWTFSQHITDNRPEAIVMSLFLLLSETRGRWERRC